MDKPINNIGDITSPSSYKTLQSKPAERSDSDIRRDNAKFSAKYIIENKSIVYEQYDQYGRLISRVPWSANSLNEKA